MINHNINKLIILLIFLIMISCGGNQRRSDQVVDNTVIKKVDVPEFNRDSAFLFVEKQVDFGPRVPNTKAHNECAKYLGKTLERYTPYVTFQDFRARAFDGTLLNGKNIIASFEPEKESRILLCAHWDSRPFADHDPDPKNHYKPIDGANDGASGVGVLLEIARILKTHKPRVGVDILFFDAEDYGPHKDDQQQNEADYWGLGSQYWSKNPHVYNYKARFVILLDMVGVSNPQFLMEGFSMHYAPDKVKKVWDIAGEIGYGAYFKYEEGGYITDDHYYINKYKKLPAIDIIHLDPGSSNKSFFPYWHTLRDNMKSIDKEALGIVGQTVLTVVFWE
ncbi:MAG: M28 family peptidase [Bacteroidetes bacterium]|nr:M28 family peptidase [Bacteroidota bacterium]